MTLSINDNVKTLEHINQTFRRTTYWNEYRSEKKQQSRLNG